MNLFGYALCINIKVSLQSVHTMSFVGTIFFGKIIIIIIIISQQEAVPKRQKVLFANEVKKNIFLENSYKS